MKDRFTKQEILRLEHALIEEKQRILKQGKATDEVMESAMKATPGGSAAHRTHVADQGTENYQREMASRFKSLECRVLREIDAALHRINEGTYGLCEKCGKPIPKARLKAVPHARSCMKCMRG